MAVWTSRCRQAARAGIAALALGALVGCAKPTGIYDKEALAKANNLAVLPAVSAPGADGKYAGPMLASVVIGSLAETGRYRVEGPGRLRKAMAQEASEGAAAWTRGLQAKLARKLQIDMLVVGELTDYRYTKERHTTSFFFGSTSRTASTYWVGVAIRIIEPVSDKLMYSGQGTASSEQGYGPAVAAATAAALKELKEYLAGLKS
jgi:hypothetical protein